MITEELREGHDSFRVYVNGLTENQLVSVNQNLDGFFGHVESYTILRKVNRNVKLVYFKLEASNNYYAYQNLMNQLEIPEHVEAQVLAAKVKQIIEECQTESDYQTVVNYHDYIVTHTTYGFLEGDDEYLSYTAQGALLHGEAVCNGYAEAMELLLLCSGFDSYMVIGNTVEGPHAWNLVYIDSGWYHVDTTWDDPVPDTGDDVLHVYLNVDDDVMRKTHTWNESAYPESLDLEKNYYTQEQIAFEDKESLISYITRREQEDTPFEIMTLQLNLNQSDFEDIMDAADENSVTWQSYGDEDYMVYWISFQNE
jgi:hypothetical protein